MSQNRRLRLTTGMTLRAMPTGRTYRVQGVDDERVVVSGPYGSLGVERDDLECNIRVGLVEIEAWP